MPSNSSSNRTGRRNGTGARRRPSGDHSCSNAPRGEDRPYREHTTSLPAKKQGFFARILSLIGLGSPGVTKKKAPAATSSSRPVRADRPQSSTARQSRNPERIEVTTPRVYVGNLSFDATESDLQELFSGIGSVQNVEIVANRDTHRSKGFGFVQMTTVEEAKRAVAELHDKEYMGRKMVVSGAKAVPESRNERSERRTGSSDGTSDTVEAAAA